MVVEKVSPWEVEMRDGHKLTEISVVETIKGHRRWSLDDDPEFLSMYSESMGSGDESWAQANQGFIKFQFTSPRGLVL